MERHKARLTAEFTRARLRRQAGTVESLREQVTAKFLGGAAGYPRWVRVNALKTSIEEQLATTFAAFTRVLSVKHVTTTPAACVYVDDHIPNLLAISPGFEITKTEAYVSGAVILQDKASCFPAYLLDPRAEDGDVIDSCAAPGNKTTHLAAIVHSRIPEGEEGKCAQTVYAFEKDAKRSRTLEKMVSVAGAKDIVRMSFGQDFLRVDPKAALFKDVGCLLLDPSCSGSGIVGRDDMPAIELPDAPGAKTAAKQPPAKPDRKRKRENPTPTPTPNTTAQQPILIDDDGHETLLASSSDLQARLEALSSFQLLLLQHAFKFPAAKKITYSTCSIHRAENEEVVLRALRSEVARERGWRVLRREEQVRGMREWPVRGVGAGASDGGEDDDKAVADACIRSYQGDGRGVMGFFVAAFVRDAQPIPADSDGPYVRDEDGRIVRDVLGMPTLKPGVTTDSRDRSTREEVLEVEGDKDEDDMEEEDDSDSSSDSSDDDDDDGWGGFAD